MHKDHDLDNSFAIQGKRFRMTKIKNPEGTKCWQECGAIGTLIHCWWEYKMVQHFGRQTVSYKTKYTFTIAAFNCALWY